VSQGVGVAVRTTVFWSSLAAAEVSAARIKRCCVSPRVNPDTTAS
jgi:hypothetical protein